MPTFDYTIHVSDVVVFVVGLIAFFKVFLTVRDSLRDMTRQIGSKDPPDGLLGDVMGLKHEARKTRDRLIEIGAELGMKQVDRS